MVSPEPTTCCSKCYNFFRSTKRYDDFTFRHGKVYQNTEDKNFYYRVERRYDKLPSKVMSDFTDYFDKHIKEIHPLNQNVKKLDQNEDEAALNEECSPREKVEVDQNVKFEENPEFDATQKVENKGEKGSRKKAHKKKITKAGV